MKTMMKEKKVYVVLAWMMTLVMVAAMMPGGSFAGEQAPAVESPEAVAVMVADEEVEEEVIEEEAVIAEEAAEPEAPAVEEEVIAEEAVIENEAIEDEATDEEVIDEEAIEEEALEGEEIIEEEDILLEMMAEADGTAIWGTNIAPDISDWTGTDNLITIEAGARGTLTVPAGVQLTIIGDGTVDGGGIDIVMGDDARVIWRADYSGDEVSLYMRQSAGELLIADGGAIRKTRGFGSAISTNNGTANGNSRVSITIDGGVVEAQDGHAITFHSGGTLKMLRGSLVSSTSSAIYTQNGAGSPSVEISGGTVSTNGVGGASEAIAAHTGSVEISGDAHVFGMDKAISISGDSLAIGGNALVETGNGNPSAMAVTIGRQAKVHIKENATVRSAVGTAIGSISTASGSAGVTIEGGAVVTESGVAIDVSRGGFSLTGGTVNAGTGKAIDWSATSQKSLTIGENAAVIVGSGTAITRKLLGGYDYQSNLDIVIDSPNVKVGPGGTLIEALGAITLTSPHDIAAEGGMTLINAPLANPYNSSISMNISTDSPVRVVGTGNIGIDAKSRLTLGGSSSIVASGGADAVLVRTSMYQTQGYYGPGDIIEVGGDVTVNIPVIAETGAPVRVEKVAVIGGTGIIEAKGAGDAAIHSLAKDAILTINTNMLKAADGPLVKAEEDITIKGSGHIAAGAGIAVKAAGNVKVADENIKISAAGGTAIAAEGDVLVESGNVKATIGSAIVAEGDVVVEGGIVEATIGLAILAEGDVDVNGGLVFAYGDAVVGNGNVIVADGKVVVDGEGMAIAWNEAAGVREYENGKAHHIVKLPNTAGAKAVWGPDVDADPAGIVYENGDNNGLVALPVNIMAVVPEYIVRVEGSNALVPQTGGGTYLSGDKVAIDAGVAAAGKVFEGWTSVDGIVFANANSAKTTFVMPEKDVVVKANWSGSDPIVPIIPVDPVDPVDPVKPPKPVNPVNPGNSGNGGGNNGAGIENGGNTIVRIIREPLRILSNLPAIIGQGGDLAPSIEGVANGGEAEGGLAAAVQGLDDGADIIDGNNGDASFNPLEILPWAIGAILLLLALLWLHRKKDEEADEEVEDEAV